MSATHSRSLFAAAALAVLASGASAATLGEQLANGSVSEAAFTQLIAGSGLSAEEARGLTSGQVLQIKFKDD